MHLRDKTRYGKFKANSNEGEVIVDITICGWGERIKIYKDETKIADVDTVENEDSVDYVTYEENEKEIIIDNVIVQKPFLRTIKRYK